MWDRAGLVWVPGQSRVLVGERYRRRRSPVSSARSSLPPTDDHLGPGGPPVWSGAGGPLTGGGRVPEDCFPERGRGVLWRGLTGP